MYFILKMVLVIVCLKVYRFVYSIVYTSLLLFAITVHSKLDLLEAEKISN